MNRRRSLLLCAGVFLLAFGVRGCLALILPAETRDSEVYARVAQNILLNGCVSTSPPEVGECAPSWGGNSLPGYPLFMAAVLFCFPGSGRAVLLAQSLVFAGAAAYLVHALLALARSRRLALACGLTLALSPLTVFWGRFLLSETLSVAAAAWLMAELVRSVSAGRLRVVGCAAAVAVSAFLRLDALLLCVPVAVAALALHGARGALRRCVAVGLLLALPLGGWWLRCVTAGLPPRPQLAVPDGWRPPDGGFALQWTWIREDRQLVEWLWPLLAGRYDLMRLDSAGLEAGERARVSALLDELRPLRGRAVPAHVDEAFAALARERAARAPLRTWVGLPLLRALSLWTNTRPSTLGGWPRRLPPTRAASAAIAAYRVLLLAALLVALAQARRRWRRPWFAIPAAAAALALARTAALALGGLVEPRYLLICAPFLEVGVWVLVAARLGWRDEAGSERVDGARALSRIGVWRRPSPN